MIDLSTFYAHQRRGLSVRRVLLAVYLATMTIYFGWRFTVFNWDQPLFASVFLAAELTVLALALMSCLLQWKPKERTAREAPEGLRVDVFVPTYNEAVPLVRRTVLAALNITYPHETWLLDDGARPELKALAEQLGCHYLARDTNRGAKPGNLNHALQYASGDFIAVIDCDHIAQRDYLSRLLGYFDDARVAFVQAPQDYYNTNAYQYRNNARLGLLWHDQTGFFAAGQVGRDRLNAATCCGTSTIVRRAVIDEIGGFPEETVTEDIHVAIKAQKLGYSSVYHPLPLAYGVAPVDLGEFQKQRLRWGQGNVQAVREEGLPFTTRLSFGQNVGYSYLGFLYAEGWARLVFYLTPPVVAFTQTMPIAPTHDFLWYFLPYFLTTIVFFEELGRGDQRFHMNEQMAMARFPVFIASTFAVFRKRIKWRVSSKEFVGHFQPYLLAPQLIVLVLNVAAAAWALINPVDRLIADYSMGLYAFGIVWCAFIAWLSIGVVRESIRCAKNKRTDYRFDLQLPLEVDVDGTGLKQAETVRLSAVGMSFRVDGGVPADPDADITGRIYLPGFCVPFRARPETDWEGAARDKGGDQVVRCLFEWDDEALCDRLDLSLHACVWHRRLKWDGPWFLTPLEWLAAKLGLARDGRTEMRRHAAVLYRPQGEDGGERRLGLLLPRAGYSGRELVAFEPLAPGDRVVVTWIAGEGAVDRVVEVGDALKPAEVASAGENDVTMYTFAALDAARESAPQRDREPASAAAARRPAELKA